MLEMKVEGGRSVFTSQKWHDNRNMRVFVIQPGPAQPQEEHDDKVIPIQPLLPETEEA